MGYNYIFIVLISIVIPLCGLDSMQALIDMLSTTEPLKWNELASRALLSPVAAGFAMRYMLNQVRDPDTGTDHSLSSGASPPRTIPENRGTPLHGPWR